MTTRPTPLRGTTRLPDPPQREPDEMTAYDHLHRLGNAYHLAMHFGNPETTLVEADRWIVATFQASRTTARRPDLLIAFNVSHQQYRANNGYVVSEQGKPPDFVLEVASESTADIDTGAKRRDYAALGIAEYWRFDETGNFHGTRLAGDRLVDDHYEAIDIQELEAGILQGYSASLDLFIRWDQGRLEWHDPATGRHIPTLQDERAIAEAKRAQAENERRRAQAAEDRINKLEAELARRDQQG